MNDYRYAIKLTKDRFFILVFRDSDQGREALSQLLDDIDTSYNNAMYYAYHTFEDGNIRLSHITDIYNHNINCVKTSTGSPIDVLARITMTITITQSSRQKEFIDAIVNNDKKWALLNIDSPNTYIHSICNAIIHDQLDVYL